MAKCVVLHTSSQYSRIYEPELRKIFFEERPDLVSAVGVDCETWEEAMDYLCVELDISGEEPDAFCNTTSHPRESLRDVVAFAEKWCELNKCARDVRVIEI